MDFCCPRFRRLLLGLLVFACGCATAPSDAPLFSGLSPQPSDAANVYLLRPHNHFARWASPIIFFNGTRIVDLPDGTYTMLQVAAGTYSITTERSQVWSGEWDIKGELKVENNHTYFLALIRETTSRPAYFIVGSAPVSVEATYLRTEAWTTYREEDATPILRSLRFVKPETPVLAK